MTGRSYAQRALNKNFQKNAFYRIMFELNNSARRLSDGLERPVRGPLATSSAYVQLPHPTVDCAGRGPSSTGSWINFDNAAPCLPTPLGRSAENPANQGWIGRIGTLTTLIAFFVHADKSRRCHARYDSCYRAGHSSPHDGCGVLAGLRIQGFRGTSSRRCGDGTWV
jgi:hypothetical protein